MTDERLMPLHSRKPGSQLTKRASQRRNSRAPLRASRPLIPLGPLVLCALAILACNAPTGLSSVALFPAGAPLVTPDPLATATATPFGPLQPTPLGPEDLADRGQPTPDPSVPYTGDFPGPIEPSAIPVPPPAPVIPFDPQVVNILLLGSDERTWSPGHHRTDAIMIISLDPSNGRVTLLSVPRDLYVYIPGWRVDRINVADSHGGAEVAAMTVLYNLGIPVHHWARVRFEGFIAIIDSLGGIDVEVTRHIQDECDEVEWEFSPGIQHMDGFTALCYARLRKTTSDFDRLRRQQLVIQAVFRRILTLDGLTRVPELFSRFSKYIETDIGVEHLVPFVPLATGVAADPSRVHRYSIDSTMAEKWIVPYSGAWVLLPNHDAIRALLQTAFVPQ